jgi:hypothetical protein
VNASASITITPVANGFIVESGCLRLVFQETGALEAEVVRWINDPAQVESEYAQRYYPERGSGGPMETGLGFLSSHPPGNVIGGAKRAR